MKKYLWTSAAVIAAFCLAFAACGGGGGGPEGPETPGGDGTLVLFEDGVWNSDLGAVTVKNESENDDIDNVKQPDTVTDLAKSENNLYTVTAAGDFAAFYFENTIDVSDYTKLIVEIDNALAAQYWSGGQLFFADDTGWADPVKGGAIVKLAKFGYWENTVGESKTTQTFNFADPKIKQDFPSKVVDGEDVPDPELDMEDYLDAFAGFRAKGTGIYSVKKIYLAGGSSAGGPDGPGGGDGEIVKLHDFVRQDAEDYPFSGYSWIMGSADLLVEGNFVRVYMDFTNFSGDAGAKNNASWGVGSINQDDDGIDLHWTDEDYEDIPAEDITHQGWAAFNINIFDDGEITAIELWGPAE